MDPMETLDARLAIAGQTRIQEAAKLLHQAASDLRGKVYNDERYNRLQKVIKELDQLQDDAAAHVDETLTALVGK